MYEVDILPVLCFIHQVLEIQDKLYLYLTRQRKAFGAQKGKFNEKTVGFILDELPFYCLINIIFPWRNNNNNNESFKNAC